MRRKEKKIREAPEKVAWLEWECPQGVSPQHPMEVLDEVQAARSTLIAALGCAQEGRFDEKTTQSRCPYAEVSAEVGPPVWGVRRVGEYSYGGHC
jgi:hypothetical protein